MTRTDSCHPSLLVLNDPFQRIDSVLLLPDFLLKPVKMFQDQPHINTDLVDVFTVTIDAPRGVLDLPFVIVESLLLHNDVGPEISLQSIALKG